MKTRNLLCAVAVLLFAGLKLYPHCQIPCGIFDDDTKFKELFSDIDTIAKSMKEINALSADPAKNINQLVRWVNNKEAHAQKVQDAMAEYFLAQRVKLEWKDAQPERYQQLVLRAHAVTVLAMKCKHSADPAAAAALHDALHAFQDAYGAK